MNEGVLFNIKILTTPFLKQKLFSVINQHNLFSWIKEIDLLFLGSLIVYFLVFDSVVNRFSLAHLLYNSFLLYIVFISINIFNSYLEYLPT